jgi:hypothetical protein
MDWSLLRPHTKYPLLRENVLYTGSIPVCTLSIVHTQHRTVNFIYTIAVLLCNGVYH